MKKIIIEVTPRITDGSYYASQQGTSTWEDSGSIEEAVIQLIVSLTKELGLKDDDVRAVIANSNNKRISSRLALLNLTEMLRANNIELEVHFLPDQTR